ncbi:MAG: hypothetical protein HY360_24870 [Verrucomicrobia bacterium]|nr:hypothetical protein [Verrucomicrobiota bacterium]
MSVQEIIERVKALPPKQRRAVETALHDFRKETEDIETRLKRAAKALRADYCEDAELTAFTDLDSEPFHA